jgi:hypothetical protein
MVHSSPGWRLSTNRGLRRAANSDTKADTGSGEEPVLAGSSEGLQVPQVEKGTPESVGSMNYAESITHSRRSWSQATISVTKTTQQWTNRCKCGHVSKTLMGQQNHWNNNQRCIQSRSPGATFDDNWVSVRADSSEEQRWQAILAIMGTNMQILVELWPTLTEAVFRNWYMTLRDIRQKERDLLFAVSNTRLRRLNQALTEKLGIDTRTLQNDLCTYISRESWLDIVKNFRGVQRQAAELEFWNANPKLQLSSLATASDRRLFPALGVDAPAATPDKSSGQSTDPHISWRAKYRSWAQCNPWPASDPPVAEMVREHWSALWHSLPGQSELPLPAPRECHDYKDHVGGLAKSRQAATTNITKTIPKWTKRCKCGHRCRSTEGLMQHWNTNKKCQRLRSSGATFQDSHVSIRTDSEEEISWQTLLAVVEVNMQILVELWPAFTDETYRRWFLGLREIRLDEKTQPLASKEYRLRVLNRELSASLGIHTNSPLLDLCTSIVREDWVDIIRHSAIIVPSENAADLEQRETVLALSAFLAQEKPPSEGRKPKRGKETFIKSLQRTQVLPRGDSSEDANHLLPSEYTPSDSLVETPDSEVACLLRLMSPKE